MGLAPSQYIVTVLVAGAFGLAMVLGPELVKSRLHTSCDVVHNGTLGSIWLAMGVVAILGLRDPLKFVPLLLVQLIYKVVWFASIFVPLWMTGRFPAAHAITTVLFGVVVVGDLIAIPFRYVFAKPSPT